MLMQSNDNSLQLLYFKSEKGKFWVKDGRRRRRRRVIVAPRAAPPQAAGSQKTAIMSNFMKAEAFFIVTLDLSNMYL